VPDALVVAESVPQAAPRHPVPASLQLTPRFLRSFKTVALNVSCCPTCTDPLPGLTATLIARVTLASAGSVKPAQPDTPREKNARAAATDVFTLDDALPLEDIWTLSPDWKTPCISAATGHPGGGERCQDAAKLREICRASLAERFSQRYRPKVKIWCCTDGQEICRSLALLPARACAPQQCCAPNPKMVVKEPKWNFTRSAATVF
jgi:hypothetical protein